MIMLMRRFKPSQGFSPSVLCVLQGAPGQAGMPGPPGPQGAAVSDYFDDWVR